MHILYPMNMVSQTAFVTNTVFKDSVFTNILDIMVKANDANPVSHCNIFISMYFFIIRFSVCT